MVMKKGFTLIELIIVIVIIGILAAIAAPMMAGNVNRAKKSEAVSVMGAIRTAERLYYVDQSSYRTVAVDGWGTTPLNTYITQADLDGRYFNSAQYSVTSDNGWYVRCTGTETSGTALGAMNMNLQNGNILGYQ
jgi:type IV pilus assembly protein PilA